MSLPETQKALVLSSLGEPADIVVKTVPTPTPSPGSAIIRVLSTHVASYLINVFTGKRPNVLSLPIIPGGGGIGRVAAIGPDTATLSPGQLVFIDVTIRARDEPTLAILQGVFGGGPAQKLMDGEWRNGTFAEYVKIPLENIVPLDEEVLIKDMGYTFHELGYIMALSVAFGGLVDINLQPGETIVVAPSTGWFGGAAVNTALGMGARVIAAGRNEVQLKKMEEIFKKSYTGRFSYVKLTGNTEADAQAITAASPGNKGTDAYIDFSPPEAAQSHHIKSCLMTLKPYGRVSFMGGIQGDVSIPYGLLMFKNLRISGKFMYERRDLARLIMMVEAGLIKLGAQSGWDLVASFKLEDIQEALEVAEKNPGFGKEVVMEP